MRIPKDAFFIRNKFNSDDIVQGILGDCWFLSALSSLAQTLNSNSKTIVKRNLLERVIQQEENLNHSKSTAGIYRFQLEFIKKRTEVC